MRNATIALLAAALLAPALTGCDREVSHTEKTTENPVTGTTSTKERTTYQRPDGSTYTESSKTSTANPDHPAAP